MPFLNRKWLYPVILILIISHGIIDYISHGSLSFKHSFDLTLLIVLAVALNYILISKEKLYSQLIKVLSYPEVPIAHHQMIYDETGTTVDYRFIYVNKAFESLLKMPAEDIVGKTVLEILPDTEKYWIEKYAEVAAESKPQTFDNYSRALNKWFNVSVYPPQQGEFATIVTDIPHVLKRNHK